MKLAFQFLHTSPRWQLHVVGSESKPGAGSVRMFHVIFYWPRIGVMREGPLDFLPVYTVAISH